MANLEDKVAKISLKNKIALGFQVYVYVEQLLLAPIVVDKKGS